jgi:16S rRNA (guanine527-N7)-methyltransferase
MSLGEALGAGIGALGLDLETTAQGKLLAYVALLAKWNRTYNLTAIRDPIQMVTHHVLDSLAVVPHLPRVVSLRLIDIGSGAGLPGIPIAVARPLWRVALLDSSRKKTAFLRQAVAELPLDNVEVVVQRAEDYDPEPRFDVAISRAYADLSRFAKVARRLTRSGGSWIAMKGTDPASELADLPSDVRRLGVRKLDIPGLVGERHIVGMQAA